MKKLLAIFSILISLNVYSQAAPEITLKNELDSTITLSSLKGKVVLVDFWATWCGPCRQANSKLKKLYKKYKDEGLEILSISVDENKDYWKKVIKRDKLDWVHMLDERGYANAWHINYLPSTFLIDKTGSFRMKYADVHNVEETIKLLLKE